MNSLSQDKGRTLVGMGLVGLGVLFLLGQVFNFNIFGALWPFFVILPGAVFLYFTFTGGKQAVGLAVPGALITGTGVILLYQSITGHWESWAYVWTLYGVFLGLALNYMGDRTGDQNLRNVGRGFIRGGSIAFVCFAVLFELVIFNEGGIFGTLALPLLLIGLGVLLLFRGGIPLPGSGKVKRDETPLYTGANVVGTRANDNAGGSRLREEIDAALAEDDPDDKPKNS